MPAWSFVFLVIWGIRTTIKAEDVDDPACVDPAVNRGLFQKRSYASALKSEEVVDTQTDQFAPISTQKWNEYLAAGAVDYTVVAQGELGDCYLLAALISIGYSRPDIITNMFTNEELLEGSNPVYTVKFWINGKETKVAVNDKVPFHKKEEPWFGRGRDGARWPSIIEKAYAKMFGDYMAIRGGNGGDVFKAITQAPVVGFINADVDKMALFNEIKDAVSKKFILGAGTDDSNCWFDSSKGPNGANRKPIGVSCGHAYTVLGAEKLSEKFPHAVKMYNPWNANWYNGAIKNQDPEKGVFYVTLDEFQQNFDALDIAKVRKNAVVSPLVLDSRQSVVALEFEMGSNDGFSVQLEWPIWRFYDPKRSQCRIEPNYLVAVAKSQSPTEYVQAKTPSYYSAGTSSARADLPGGSGKYVIYVSVEFPMAKDWLKSFVINVYGAPTKLRPSTQYTDPAGLFQAMGLSASLMEIAGDAATDTDDDLERGCGYYIDRISKLNNGQQIASSGKDPLFPEVMESVGRAGGKCGDSARGIQGSCSKYNNWQSLMLVKDGPQCPAYPNWRPDPECNCNGSPGVRKKAHFSGKDMYTCQKPQSCGTGNKISNDRSCVCREPGMVKKRYTHEGDPNFWRCVKGKAPATNPPEKPAPIATTTTGAPAGGGGGGGGSSNLCPNFPRMNNRAGCTCGNDRIKKEEQWRGLTMYTCRKRNRACPNYPMVDRDSGCKCSGGRIKKSLQWKGKTVYSCRKRVRPCPTYPKASGDSACTCDHSGGTKQSTWQGRMLYFCREEPEWSW